MNDLIELKQGCCEIFPVIVPSRTSLKSINFYLVKREHSLSLIDAGWNNDDCWGALNNTLKMNGYTINDLTEILLTHHHSDHSGLVNRITTTRSIPVYAHPDSIPRLKRDKDFLEMRVEFYAQLYQEMGCGENGARQIDYLKRAVLDNKDHALQADINAITDNELLHFSIVDFPGHAPDQIGFYDKKLGWLFAGDLLIEHLSSNALVEPDESGNRLPTLTQHIDSLKKCRDLNTSLLFSGHGILIENPNSLISKRLERMMAKGERLIQLIGTGISTANTIAEAYYKNTYFEQFSLVMSEIIGHLDYLEAKGRITKDMVKGVWHYEVKEWG